MLGWDRTVLKKLFPPVLLRICVFVSGLKKSQPESLNNRIAAMSSFGVKRSSRGSRRHGQVRVTREACCLERFIERLNISILVDIYLTDSLIYSNIICVSAHLRTGWQQKPGVIHRYAKDAILKNCSHPFFCVSVYLSPG